MKKKWLWIGLGAVLLIVLVAVNVRRQASGNTVPVQLARVRVEDITARVRAPGKIEPKTQVKISADIMGKVTHLAVKEGDRVRKGQLLLQLDDAQRRSDQVQMRTTLASANARKRDADATFRVTEANFTRQRALYDQKLLSQAEWDQATSGYETAHATATSASEEVGRSEAALQGALDNLGKTRFVAPFDGVVSALNVEQGEVVIMGTMNNPGTQILTVSDLSRMLVKADVDESDVVDMKFGQKAKITVDDVRDEAGIAGRIFSVIAGGNIIVDMIVQSVSKRGTTDISFTIHENDLEAATIGFLISRPATELLRHHLGLF